MPAACAVMLTCSDTRMLGAQVNDCRAIVAQATRDLARVRAAIAAKVSPPPPVSQCGASLFASGPRVSTVSVPCFFCVSTVSLLCFYRASTVSRPSPCLRTRRTATSSPHAALAPSPACPHILSPSHPLTLSPSHPHTRTPAHPHCIHRIPALPRR